VARKRSATMNANIAVPITTAGTCVTRVVDRASAATAISISVPLLEHEYAALVAPVHPCFEVGPRAAAFEDEHQPQHVLVEQRDVCRIDVELGGGNDKGRRVG